MSASNDNYKEGTGLKRVAAPVDQDFPDSKLLTSPPKRCKTMNEEDTLQMRFLIPSKVAGAIIGSNGDNITRLRNQYGVTIRIPDCDGPERVLLIEGPKDVLYNLLALEILDKLVGYYPSYSSFRSGIDLRVVLSNGAIGSLIGRGGVRISELRMNEKAKFKIFDACCPKSRDRIVVIHGNSAEVEAGIKKVYSMIQEYMEKQVYQEDPGEHYNPEHYWMGNPANYGGYEDETLVGVGPGPSSRLVDQRHLNIYLDPSSSNEGEGNDELEWEHKRGWSGGRGRNNGKGRRRGRDRSRDHGRKGTSSRGDGSGSSRGTRGSEYGNSGGNSYKEETETIQYTIPDKYAPAIIGHRGLRIHKIEKDSGTSINIDGRNPGERVNIGRGGDRVVTITGAHDKIQQACALLQEIVFREFPGDF